MPTYDVAFVGTGVDPEDEDASGFAMAYHHADAYELLEDCALVACADVVPERASAFADAFGIADEHAYEDHETMLAEVEPDVVSVCVPPAVHAEIAIDCARAGVDAVHCEKPMDLTWGGARRMAQVCWRHDVQLTFNHQRRFKPSWVEARELIADGTIGDLERIETTPPNLYDWGTHAIDFAGDVAGDQPAEWVLGGIDYREEQLWFGAHNENQAHAHWQYEDGTTGIVATGEGADLVPAFFRFTGTEGVLDLEPDESDADLRWRRHGDDDWQRRSLEETEWTVPIDDAIAHVIDCLGTDAEPVLSARTALNATEIIFGVWESVRRRGRVDFPLEIEDNPLHDLVESGDLDPVPAGEE